MYTVRKVAEDLYWVGGNDVRLALFENMHPIPRGVSYNSYLLIDEKTVLFDAVDWAITQDFIRNVEMVLGDRELDYLVVNHMEPDHCGSIEELILRYPKLKIISSEKSFMLMHQFNYHVDGHEDQVEEGDTRNFGKHTVTFVAAPMVHWPEVMMTYDITTGTLFSADAFGSFGALHGALFNDEMNFDRDWIDDARRYYTNIVGKYGPFVQSALKKAATIDIKMICPLHGPVWRNDFGYLLDKYDKWSRYEPEEKGVLIIYGSMYGNTEYAAESLASLLHDKGMHNVRVYDVSSTDVSYLIAETFKYSHIVLACPTFNLGIYPPMKNYLNDMKALNVQNRTFALIENGSWAPQSGTLMSEYLDEELKMMNIMDETLSINSAITDLDVPDLNSLVDALIEATKE
ncbi:FprA family A-type flavoprotein [Enterococcus sp. HY326]|uniref:FprA family A-type flavoprotein n=1 Tax=Enterococcus sp. HY326 TaxID=2971265 RepID=UPI002240BD42|nr:FprA family A-type flavoprotein [Enterococcus sp. HY326]